MSQKYMRFTNNLGRTERFQVDHVTIAFQRYSSMVCYDGRTIPCNVLTLHEGGGYKPLGFIFSRINLLVAVTL